MKEGWDIKALGQIGRVSMCKRILKKQTLPTGDVPFYKIGTFGKQPNAFIPKKLYQEYREKYSFPKKGDVLISASGTIGRRVVYDGKPAYFQDSNIVWVDNNEKLVTNEFLYAFYGFCDWNPSKGATISRLYNDDLRKIKIPIPPIEEQHQIVEILDQAFAKIDQAISNIERNIQNAEDLFQSKLNQIFSQKGKGWEEKKLGDVCVLQRGFDLPKRLRIKGEIPLISSSGIIDSHSESKVKGAGVVTGRSGSIGNVFFIKHDFWPLNTTLYVKKFYDNNPKYIYYLLRNFDLKKYSSGSGVPTLNRNFVHSELVKVSVDKEEQIKIVNLLDKLELQTSAIKLQYRKKIESLKDLKKSLLEKAFSGELTQQGVEI